MDALVEAVITYTGSHGWSIFEGNWQNFTAKTINWYTYSSTAIKSRGTENGQILCSTNSGFVNTILANNMWVYGNPTLS